MIEYTFVRVQPLIDPTTNNVTSWVIGLSAHDTTSNFVEYIDVSEPASVQKPLDQWTGDEIRNFAMEVATEHNMFTSLYNNLQRQLTQPRFGSPVTI